MSKDNKITTGESIDDFESLLNSFINTKVEDLDDESGDTEKTEVKKEENKIPAIIDETHLSEDAQKENEELSKQFEEELATTFAEARTAIEEEKNKPTLGSDESELAQAFVNFQASVQKLSQTYLNRDF
ncbi:MAG: hypothetical protein IJ677_08945, partial [Alphaproteobacteria bacterium]|nr:hypothetical protein [Alphaproteobacteria bacterium]